MSNETKVIFTKKELIEIKDFLSSQLDKNLELQKIICNFKNFNNSMRKELINLQRDYSILLNTYLKVAQ